MIYQIKTPPFPFTELSISFKNPAQGELLPGFGNYSDRMYYMKRNIILLALSQAALTYAPSEKAKAQALNDFIVFGTVTITSFSSGAVQHALGWQTVNIAAIPFLVLVGIANLWLRSTQRTTATDLNPTRVNWKG